MRALEQLVARAGYIPLYSVIIPEKPRNASAISPVRTNDIGSP